MDGWSIRLQSNRPVLCIKFNVSSRICLFTESGKSLFVTVATITVVTKIHLQDLNIRVVAVMQRFQREGPVYVHQSKGRARRSVPYLQCHHLLGTLVVGLAPLQNSPCQNISKQLVHLIIITWRSWLRILCFSYNPSIRVTIWIWK